MTTIIRGNQIPLSFNSKNRAVISDSTSDYTMVLSKSIRNMSSILVADIVIPNTILNIASRNNYLIGAFVTDDGSTQFEMYLPSQTYDDATLAIALQDGLNGLAVSMSNGLTWTVEYDDTNNTYSMLLDYTAGSSHSVWGVDFTYSMLMDTIGLGTGKTSTSVFRQSLQVELDFSITRQSSLSISLKVLNITSKALTSAINTSYIANANKIFDIESAESEVRFIVDQTVKNTTAQIPARGLVGTTNGNTSTSVSISSDGQYFVSGAPSRTIGGSGSEAGRAYVYNADNLSAPIELIGSGAIGATVNQGYSVAISGSNSTVVVGAPNDDTNAGATWVYGRSGNQFIEIVKLTQSVATSYEGSAVAVSDDGSVIAVGAPTFSGEGSTVVYRLNGGLYEATTLNEADVAGLQGTSVALSQDGNVLAVGAPGSNNVYLYRYNGATWSLGETILSEAGITGTGEQGTSVSLSDRGDVLAVGIPFYDGVTYFGVSVVYKYNGTDWTTIPREIIIPDQQNAFNQFGQSVSLSGDGLVLATGDPRNGTGSRPGLVQVNTFNGTDWASDFDLYPPNAFGDAWFGYSVSLNGNGSRLLTGEAYADVASPGKIYIFNHTTVDYIDPIAYGNNSSSSIVSGDTLVVGYSNDGVGVGSGIGAGVPGAVWVYSRNGTEWVETAVIRGDSANGIGETLYISDDQQLIAVGGTAGASIGGYYFLLAPSNGTWESVMVGSGGGFGGAVYDTVVISGDGKVFAALGYRSSSASVRVHHEDDWNSYQTINTPATDGTASSIAISTNGTTIVVGAPTTGTDGEVFVYVNSGGGWVLLDTLAVVLAGAEQGYSVAIKDDILLVGAPGTGTGRILVYAFDGATWQPNGEILPPSGTLFGRSISFSSEETPRIGVNGGWVYHRPDTTWDLIGQDLDVGAESISMGGTNYVYAGVYERIVHDTMEQTYTMNLPSLPMTIFGISNAITTAAVYDNGVSFTAMYDAPTGSLYIKMNGTSEITGVMTAEFNMPEITFDEDEKKSDVIYSKALDLSINNNVIRAVSSYNNFEGKKVIVDNLMPFEYRKLFPGYTLEAGSHIDIQLRDEFDRIVDLNGADWVMTVYATIQS